MTMAQLLHGDIVSSTCVLVLMALDVYITRLRVQMLTTIKAKSNQVLEPWSLESRRLIGVRFIYQPPNGKNCE